MKERVWRRGPAPETPIHNCPIEGYCVCVYNAKVMQFLFILLIILLIITLKPPMLGS